MSPQMPHGPLSKHAAPRLRAALCRVQSTITWLLTHSHDTSPSSAAAVFGGHCSLIHTIPAAPQRSAVCRGHSLIHMIPAPHQRLPCLEDIALLFAQYQPHISGCRVWKTLLFYSHDTSLTSAAAVCRGLRSLTHSRWHGAPASVAHPLASNEAAPASERQWVILWNGAQKRGVIWCPCAEKHAKARSHLMPLRGKAREGEESPGAPARKSVWRRGVTWCPCTEKRAKAISHLVPLHGKKSAKAGSHLMPLRRKAHEGEESPDAPARTLSAFKFYVSCSRPYEVVFN